jgi:hypothetical protein
MGTRMYWGVGYEIERPGEHGLGVSATIWVGGRDYHLPAFLGLPLLKCEWLEHIIVILNDKRDPVTALY